MRTLKHKYQIQRPSYLSGLLIRVERTAALAMILLWLTSGLALPANHPTHHPSNRMTTPLAMKSNWVKAGELNTARYRHTATLLAGGKVLVAGGAVGPYCDCCCARHPDSRPTDRAELYDPAAKKWSDTGSLNTARFRHSATLLENGQVLVAGGYADVYVFEGLPLTSAELYDPATGSWHPTGSFNTIQGFNSATLLANGKVLAVSRNSAELYDPATGTWSITDSPTIEAGLPTSTVLLANGKVLAVSGNSAELYDPATEMWSSAGNPKVSSFYSQTITLLGDGKVLVTGLGFSFPSSLSAELYDPNTGTWRTTGSPRTARFWESYQTTLLPDGQVLLAGGYSSSYRPAGEELYDPATGRWDFTRRLNLDRHFSTATLLPNGRVLITGGVNEGTDQQAFPYAETELYDPATGSIPIPRITGASVSGKKLFIVGENFDSGAVILLNGEEQKTRNDEANPQTTVIGKKAGKRVKSGDKLQVRNPDGVLSEEFTFSR